MEEIAICPACQKAILKKKYDCKDHTVSHETFQIWQCSDCTLAITTPRPDRDSLDKYYFSESYISHTGKARGLIDKLYLVARKFTLRRKLKLIHQVKQIPGRILDYGCGTGEFLHVCKVNGWETYGVEPSIKAREKAKEILSSNVYPTVPNEAMKFDIITLWHVLEHVSDFNATIQMLTAHLNDNGTIVVAVPNHQSFDAQYYKENWAGFDVPRHLWHFSPESMQIILKKNSLKLLKILPMKLDSFYVSMLSEQYRRQSQTFMSLINATFIGLLSNLKAKKNMNYSSLIYLIKK